MDKVIMILDEDPAFCKIYQSILGQAGYHVMVASGRKSGLGLLTRKNPQAVFTEIKLNYSSDEGIFFIEEALLERPNLTIIVVSSEDNAKIINKALDRGAADYLVKPSPDLIESPMQKIIVLPAFHTAHRHLRPISRGPEKWKGVTQSRSGNTFSGATMSF